MRPLSLPCALLVFAGACTGPALHLDNPERHPVWVDGVATGSPSLPFRYYGTTRWHAVPIDVDGKADFDHAAAGAFVAIEAPVTGWLFPLDFPLELLHRAFAGRGDTTAAIAVLPAPPVAGGEMLNAEFAAVSQRARTARASR